MSPRTTTRGATSPSPTVDEGMPTDPAVGGGLVPLRDPAY